MTNTDKTLSTERLADEFATILRHIEDGDFYHDYDRATASLGTLRQVAELLASRTQEPAERMEIGEGWEVHTLEEKQEVQRNAGIPHLPTDMTLEARLAISGRGPRAFEWTDKKHRLVYDLCREIERLAALRAASITPPAPERSKVQELRSPHGNETFDGAAIDALLRDPQVVAWLGDMRAIAMIPQPRVLP